VLAVIVGLYILCAKNVKQVFTVTENLALLTQVSQLEARAQNVSPTGVFGVSVEGC
jgi:hypothetical protein